jgi:putative resolvase
MYTIAEFAEKVHVSVKTIQKWDREGKLPARRTLTNRRYYTDEDVTKVLGENPSPDRRKVVAYCRVSSQNQKLDLRNQRTMMEQFCTAKGLGVDEWIEEIGGGLNFQRKKFLALIDSILTDQVSCLVVAHKDRLTRFGSDLIHHLCEDHQCELVIMNTEQLSPEAEMVQDLMTIVHCFSSRLYGLRNYQKALKEALRDQVPLDSLESDS